jgi:hypothetical protein
MPASGTRWYCVGAAWLGLLSLARGEFIPLVVDQGHCEFVLSTPRQENQFYLVVGSLAEASRETRIRVHTETDPGPEFLPLVKSAPDPVWQARVETQARLLDRERRRRPALQRFPPLASPPPTKVFHLFTGDRDLENPANYQAVHAELAGVGRLAQVYLDRDDRDLAGMSGTIAEVLRIFDQEVGPAAEEHLGRVLDVDRDGRFTILLTGKLGGLQNGKVQVDGFVRGSDFFRDLPAPFSNRCDMLYLNAALKPGPHLRAVMAHEFTHAVTFCEHALTAYREDPTNQDEESWLSEGLAHLVENPRELGWSNLDYRISAFLSGPEQHPLVIPDYFGAGLWRHPATRGAAFLFLHSCQAHADGELTRRLIQSPLRGIANLEAATQKPFAELFRQATVDFLQPQNYGHLDSDRKGPVLYGPRFQEISLAGERAESTLDGTAAAFFLLHSPSGSHVRLRVDGNGPIQVTLVRVPAGVPRLAARWLRQDSDLRLELTSHHGAVWLRGAGWDTARSTDQAANAAGWFGRERLDQDTSIRSTPLSVPAGMETSNALFKVLGVDVQGRPVAAWISTKAE